jgi:hypothetical protein
MYPFNSWEIASQKYNCHALTHDEKTRDKGTSQFNTLYTTTSRIQCAYRAVFRKK